MAKPILHLPKSYVVFECQQNGKVLFSVAAGYGTMTWAQANDECNRINKEIAAGTITFVAVPHEVKPGK